MNNLYFLTLKGPGNLGDVVLKRNLCSLLEPQGELHCLLAKIEYRYIPTVEHSAYETPLKFCAKLIFSALKNKYNIFVILSPGGGSNSLGSKIKCFLRLCAFKFMRLAKIHIVQVGISTEMATPDAEEDFRRESKLKKFTGYRDAISLQHAKNRGEENFGYFPDLSVLSWEDCSKFRNHVRKSGFALSIRTPILVKSGVYEEAIEKTILNFSKYVEKAQVVLINQVDDDIPVSEHFNKLTGWDFKKFDKFPYSFEDICNEYSKIQFVISNRLHVLLFASFCGCIPIPLISESENGKITGVFKDMGLEFLCFRFENKVNETEALRNHIQSFDLLIPEIRLKIQSWAIEQGNIIRELALKVFN